RILPGVHSAFRTPHSAIALPPFLHPFVVQHGGHLSLRQHLDPGRVAVRLAIEHVGHARVDDEFGAHDARGRADEHDLVAYAARGLDQRIHLGVNTTAAARHRGVAFVRQAPGVAVVPDRDHGLELLVGYHG